MSGIDTKSLLNIMRNEYNKRLYEVIGEADVMDSQGNIVIKPGLKVRHKDSQYEYTVDSVTEDPEGNISLKLRNPDVGRIDPADAYAVMSEDDLIAPQAAAQAAAPPEELPVQAAEPGEEISDDDVFVVDQEEFEKEYEVK